MAPTLGYWDLRGIVTPIRMLLAYADVSYEYKAYTLSNYTDWTVDKVELEKTLAFPNLPYYIDDNVQLTQSKTIISYLGKKYGLDAKTDEEALRMSLIMEQTADMRTAIYRVAYLPEQISNRVDVYEILHKEYVESSSAKLSQIAKFLGQNKWIAGDRLTYADFWVYDVLDFQRLLFNPKYFNAFPTLVAYMERIEEVKGVKEYLAQLERLPACAPGYAMLGNSKDFKPID